MPDKLLISGQKSSPNTVLFAHGAGAGMDSVFMDYFAKGMAIKNWQVIRFEFPYMQQIRKTGKRRPPNIQKILLQCWLEKIEQFRPSGKLIIAGKSMGGRMASMVLGQPQINIDGLLVFGYPFHPPGKPEKLRTEHLQGLKICSLFLQGERDTLGNIEEVADYTLSKNIQLEWLPDGDHSFKPRKKSGFTEQQNWQQALQKVNQFQQQIARK